MQRYSVCNADQLGSQHNFGKKLQTFIENAKTTRTPQLPTHLYYI